LFGVSKKRSLNSKDAGRFCEPAAPAPTEVVRGGSRVGISGQSTNPWRLGNRSAWGHGRPS
jgi:hypothetical protein